MNISFVTRYSDQALWFISSAKGKPVDGTWPEVAAVLALFDSEELCIQDPMMHGGRIAVLPGRKYIADKLVIYRSAMMAMDERIELEARDARAGGGE